ncbi:efflux transporter outer membrane subunit [Sphingomonas parva]|uniref:Efflux transporter outer membrane subunit n=1 Tax=Sphingomonas parva TaxID=2555898 RepID=A0A4Y8ZSN9_9SPHN|nr:efflux transporter outer membrane subunit [Sphingomonas parva]TFI59058.1 efflux transporter outer membrane subunit [Sphingomonas parva]
MIRFRAARLSRAPLLLPLLLASACASVPNLGPKPVPNAPGAYETTRSLAPSAREWPGERWWSDYRDPQLVALIDEALAASPDLTAAAARLRTAQGFAQRAGAALQPTIDAGASVEIVRQSENQGLPAPLAPHGWQDVGSVALSFSFDLDLWGKNRAALAAATSDAEAAGYDFAEARLALATAIASTYADLAALHAQRDALETILALRTQTLGLVERRVANGLGTRADLKQAEARVPQARGDLAATDEALALTRNALAALLGAGPDRGLRIARPLVAALHPEGVPADASIALIGRRPDIAAARARVEAAGSRIKEARAAFYPDINLSALVGLQSLGLGSLLSGDSFTASAGPAISLPIFHGGALSGNYRGRRGQYDEAVALYDARVVAALRETADALASQKMLATRLTESRRTVAAFEEASGLARRRYEGGLSAYLDVLSAEEGLVQARIQLADLESRAFVLDVALVRALGGGFTAS